MVAAWFGGTKERHPDVGIWFTREENGRWLPAVEVATGVQPTGPRLPTWNPVLFQAPRGPLLLFYKVGPSPSKWWGLVISSNDGGRTWSGPTYPPHVPTEINRDPYGTPLPAYNRGALCEGRDGRIFWAVAATEQAKPETDSNNEAATVHRGSCDRTEEY